MFARAARGAGDIRREKMKKIAFAAMALAALVGFMGCDTGSGTDGGSAVTYSDWQIKGSFNDWALQKLVVDEIDANKLTFEISGLYNDANVPLLYEFVLVNPDNVEYKIEGADKSVTEVTPGTAFNLGDSAAAGSTTMANVGFEAVQSSYTVTVDITDAAAPEVNLVAGSVAAIPVTNDVLLSKLQIKGNQFSEINGTAVGSWTGTAGTIDGATMTWDVLVDNLGGEFGFNSMNNFLKGVSPDVSALTAGGAATASANLSNSTGSNCSMTGMPKDGSVYTVVVTVDSTKSVADGRYAMTVALKTLGTDNWVFAAPANVYITGDVTGGWNETDDATLRPAMPVTADVATYTYTASATGKQIFKIALKADAGWGGLIGYNGIVTTGTTVAIYDSDNNIAFDAVSGTAYTITVNFTGAYTSTGKPLVTIE